MKLLTILLLFLLGCITDPGPDCATNDTDDCGVCSGGNTDMDCNGDCFGEAAMDDCEVCSGGLSEHEANSNMDCNGDCFGDAVEDECGACGGDGSTCNCADCIDTERCDCDGNVYETVQIGDQLWMAENLKTTRYNDSSEITHITNNGDWGSYDEGQFGVYNNVSSNAEIYGNLYNFAVVDDSRGVCPEGFHVPSDDEWMILTDFIAPEGIESWGNSISGGKMKECIEGSCPESEYWASPNTGATNESGFNGIPSGDRGYDSGSYDNMGYYGNFWSSSELGSTNAWYRKLDCNNSSVYQYAQVKQNGFSIRCLGD